MEKGEMRKRGKDEIPITYEAFIVWFDLFMFDSIYSCLIRFIHVWFDLFICHTNSSYVIRFIHIWYDLFICDTIFSYLNRDSTGWRRCIGCLVSCTSLSAKEPLILGLFCGKWPIKIRHPVTLRHTVHATRALRETEKRNGDNKRIIFGHNVNHHAQIVRIRKEKCRKNAIGLGKMRRRGQKKEVAVHRWLFYRFVYNTQKQIRESRA